MSKLSLTHTSQYTDSEGAILREYWLLEVIFLFPAGSDFPQPLLTSELEITRMTWSVAEGCDPQMSSLLILKNSLKDLLT